MNLRETRQNQDSGTLMNTRTPYVADTHWNTLQNEVQLELSYANE